jgi:hypothetical protein
MDTIQAAYEILLKDAATRDRPTARRLALMIILSQERYLTRDQLISRVEARLGWGCFGDSAWEDTFFRDMKVVKQAFQSTSCRLAYSRRPNQPGYYLAGLPAVSSELLNILAGSVLEVDLAQVAILRKLSFPARFQQGCSISNLARQVVANRIHQRNPQISLAEAYRQASSGEQS